jgi:hypothetical protein
MDAWSRTAEILAMTAEIYRDRKRRRKPYTGNDFNPYAPQAKAGQSIPMSELKDIFKSAAKRKRGGGNGQSVID